MDEFENDPSKYSNFDYVEKQNLEQDVKNFASISLGLAHKELIIDLPDKDSILKIRWTSQQSSSRIPLLMILKTF